MFDKYKFNGASKFEENKNDKITNFRYISNLEVKNSNIKEIVTL